MQPSSQRSIVDDHEQRYLYSCIPSSVELVLKLLQRVEPSYYDLQEAWKDRPDGSFGHFNGCELFGLRFRHLFHEHPRGPAFPLDDLILKIEEELAAGRFVIISLPSDEGWHMYVIHSRAGGEFNAVSKHGAVTLFEDQVRAKVSGVGGTDILVYDEV